MRNTKQPLLTVYIPLKIKFNDLLLQMRQCDRNQNVAFLTVLHFCFIRLLAADYYLACFLTGAAFLSALLCLLSAIVFFGVAFVSFDSLLEASRPNL